MTNTANKPLDWYAERTAYLTEFMSEERRQVLQRTLDSRTRYMTILTENTYHAQNASALVRHCEAFGIQDIHTVETRCKFNPNVNIVRGTDKWIDLHRHRTTAEAIADLKSQCIGFGGHSDLHALVPDAGNGSRLASDCRRTGRNPLSLDLRLGERRRSDSPTQISRRIRKTMNTILRKQFLAHVGQTSPEPMMIEVARAEGVFFYTPEGKHYYDLVAGVSVSNVGHANPRVVEAVQRQAADYMHIMVYGEMIERPQVRYAARIAELLPGELSSVYFVNSGA